jgi:hypothetical protein
VCSIGVWRGWRWRGHAQINPPGGRFNENRFDRRRHIRFRRRNLRDDQQRPRARARRRRGRRQGGFATNPASSSSAGGVTVSAPNPLGFGLGARGGVSFLGFYGGVNFLYYFGSSQDVSVLGQSVSVHEHTFMYGLELGYGITLLDLLTIRPQVGIGNATFSSSASGSGTVNADVGGGSNSNIYIEPGVTGLVSLGGWFVGADANVLFFPGLDNSKAAFTLHGQIGFKF